MNVISIIYLTIGVLILLLGILIFRENPNRRINRITGIMMFFAALAPIMSGFGILLKTYSAAMEFNFSMLERLFLLWEFFFPQLLIFAFIFPKEKSILNEYPKITPLLFVPHSIHFLIMLVFRSPESILSLINFSESSLNLLLQPIYLILNLILTILSYFYEYHSGIFALINLIYLILAMFIMYQGYRELKNPQLRKQVGLVLWGIRVSVGLYAITFLMPKIFPIYASIHVNYILTIVALIIGPGSIALSIIKYQFLDIRLIIRRGIIFSITSGLLVGIYLLIYENTKRLISGIIGMDLPIVEVLFLIMAVIIFHPILSSIEDTVERFFVQNRSDYRNVLQTLSHEILHIIDIKQLKDKIIRTLTESMMLENVFLILKDSTQNYTVTISGSEQIEFLTSGEFITLMKGIEEPVRAGDILSKITNEKELSLLQKLNSFMFIALTHHNDLNGVFSLGRKLTKSKFSTEDITLLRLLSDQISIALENIELYKDKLEKQRIDEEISVAREIQRMLLPHEIPEGRNFEISAMNIPSKEVGGDYYDFISLDNHLIGIAIGDISGKGIPGALLMSNLQATLRAAAFGNVSPAEVTGRINRQITRTTSAEKFATFFYGIFNTKKLVFNYTNAGHNYPILRRKNGECFYLSEADLIVGVQMDFSYTEHKIQLASGDILVFYTDGITEAINNQHDEFSEQHLLDVIRSFPPTSAEDIRNHIYEEVLDFSKDQEQYDDITLIVLRVLG